MRPKNEAQLVFMGTFLKIKNYVTIFKTKLCVCGGGVKIMLKRSKKRYYVQANLTDVPIFPDLFPD